MRGLFTYVARAREIRPFKNLHIGGNNMTKTSNYQLNQWAATDQVRRTDFNADNQKIDAALAAVPKLATGSYTGSGNIGSDQKNTLTFPFPPKLLVIVADTAGALRGGVALVRGQTHSDGIGGNYSSQAYNLTIQWSGSTVTWYSGERNAESQLNASGVTYYYFAIG